MTILLVLASRPAQHEGSVETAVAHVPSVDSGPGFQEKQTSFANYYLCLFQLV